MSRYIEIDDNRQAVVRFKLQLPLNGLADKFQTENVYYLGHSSDSEKNWITPCLTEPGPRNDWWTQKPFDTKIGILKPKSYRAPVILAYKDSQVGFDTDRRIAQYGSIFNREFSDSTWDIVVPFGETLTNGARVIIRARPWSARDAPNKTPSPIVSHMTVFRNQQGVFLPGMSDSDELQYWRILRKASGAKLGEPILDGEDVRLCWAFKDQTTGWRDYFDDVFGRRRVGSPAEVPGGILYPKLPFPRFGNIAVSPHTSLPDPHAMFMSSSSEIRDVEVNLSVITSVNGKTSSKRTYLGQDLTFRIDSVANEGQGDSGNYLLNGVTQESDTITINIWVPEREKKPRMSIFHRAFWF